MYIVDDLERFSIMLLTELSLNFARFACACDTSAGRVDLKVDHDACSSQPPSLSIWLFVGDVKLARMREGESAARLLLAGGD